MEKPGGSPGNGPEVSPKRGKRAYYAVVPGALDALSAALSTNG
jgi:hypothetical protein